MIIKATLLGAALLGAVASEDSYTYDQTPYNPVQHHFGVRQDTFDLDPLMVSLGVGALNVGYTTLLSIQNSNKNRKVCDKVNEMLNVADLPATTDDAILNFQLDEVLALADQNAANPPTLTVNGKTFVAADVKGLAAGNTAPVTDSAIVAVSVQDFDRYRALVAAAFLAMQNKLNEVLAKSTMDCNNL